MAADRAQNLQDTFLITFEKTKTPLTIFLVNGVKLQGIVTWFDNFCLLLRAAVIRSLSTSTRSRPSCPALRSSCSKAVRMRRLESDLIGTRNLEGGVDRHGRRRAKTPGG